MFRKIGRKIKILILPLVLAGLLLGGGTAYAQMGGSGGLSGASQFWKIVNGALHPINALWTLGSSTSRIVKGWFTDLDVSGTATINNVVISGVSGQLIVDETNAEALLVRKDADAGDIFVVNTSNGTVTSTGINPWNSNNYDLGLNGRGWRNVYTSGTIFASNIINNGGLNIGSGATATTTIMGASTSSLPYGITIATTGGNVGIGTDSPTNKLTIFRNSPTEANPPMMVIGDGVASSTLTGGSPGKATSTPAGDFVANNLYTGTQSFQQDAGIIDLFNLDVSASAASNTKEGVFLGPDNFPAMYVGALSDGAGSVNGAQVGIGKMGSMAPTSTLTLASTWGAWFTIGNANGTASTTITAGATSTFNAGVQFAGSINASALAPAGSSDLTVCIDSAGNLNKSATTCQVSAARYKTNILPLQSDADDLMKFKPVNFTLKSDGSARVGLIADEVEKIDPKLAIYQDGQLRNFDYPGVMAYIIKGVQDMWDKITHFNQMMFSWNASQQKQIDTLQTQINEIKAVCGK